jgi:hypothetical protein
MLAQAHSAPFCIHSITCSRMASLNAVSLACVYVTRVTISFKETSRTPSVHGKSRKLQNSWRNSECEMTSQSQRTFRIWGPRRYTYECYHLLGYSAVQSVCEPKFRRNVSIWVNFFTLKMGMLGSSKTSFHMDYTMLYARRRQTFTTDVRF